MGISLGLTGVLIFTAAVCSTLALALSWEVLRDWLTRRRVARRIEPIINQVAEHGGGSSDDLIRQFQEEQGFWGELANSLPGVVRAEQLLREARVEWRPETFLLLSTGLAFGIGAMAALASRSLVIGFPFALMGASLPYLYLLRKRKNRLNLFEEEFPESIDLLTRAIRAGHPLASGMRMVADEGPMVVAEEFRQTFEEQRFGLPFSDALLGMVDRVNLVDVRIFAIAVRARFYIRRQLRVFTAQGRMSGYALAALPPAVAAITAMIQPDYMGLLVTTAIGKMAVFTALALQVVGVLWIRKIINIDI
jgi:tight adherence protein B